MRSQNKLPTTFDFCHLKSLIIYSLNSLNCNENTSLSIKYSNTALQRLFKVQNTRIVFPIKLSKIPNNKKIYIILIDDFLIDYIPFHGKAIWAWEDKTMNMK